MADPRHHAVLLATLLGFLAACTTPWGARTIGPANFDYNQALVSSRSQQFLLNLVRLRYRDVPLFLEIDSVIAQYSVSGSAGASALFIPGAGDEVGADAGVGWSESPTVTYKPLQGEEFVRRLLAPIPPETLILLSQSGWSIERLLLCCVQQVNDLTNAPAATGPTPDYVPDNADFRRVAALLRQLQTAGLFDLAMERAPSPAGGGEDGVGAQPADDPGAFLIRLREPRPGPYRDELDQVRRLLGLPDRGTTFEVVPGSWRRQPDEIAIVGRSLVGVFYYLSQTVQAPGRHETEGRVTVTRGADGERIDWSEVTGGLLDVHSSPEPPTDAFVRVRYRDHWFWIADDDLHSKSTFSLLSLLFSLQSEGSKSGGPLLSLSAGG